METSWLSLLPALIFIVMFGIATWHYEPTVTVFLGVIFVLVGFATIMAR